MTFWPLVLAAIVLWAVGAWFTFKQVQYQNWKLRRDFDWRDFWRVMVWPLNLF
jgi:hypothetical protein